MSYPIPNAALDDRLAFVGTAGSGKTFSSGTAVERILSRKGRVVIVDPLGVWWGLRLVESGTIASPFNVVIFGGEHGDMPINEHAGALIGETVAGMAESCIIDLSGFGTKASERRFMLSFLEAIYRKASGEPVHLVFDEADLWAPQKTAEPQLQAKMEQIVRRGRVRGFVPWLITQRPAVISKDILSQADGIVAFKLTGQHDRDAIGGWIEGQADKATGKEMLASLPTMQVGQGVVWIPGRGILTTAQFPMKATYDSSRTPKRGEVKRTAELKPLDLGKLKEKLATVEAETKANDPKALRAEIAALKRQVATIPPSVIAPDPKAVEEAERRGYARGFHDAAQKAGKEISRFAEEVRRGAQVAMSAAADIDDALNHNIVSAPVPPVVTPRPVARVAPQVKPKAAPVRQPVDRDAMSPSARAILDMIHKSHPVGLSFDAAARRANISKRSSAYRKYRAEVESSDEVQFDGSKFRSLRPNYDEAYDGRATIDVWVSRLPPSYGMMLRAIAEGGKTDKAGIAEWSGVSPTSSGLGAGLRELMNLELITQDGDAYSLAEGLE